jgi:hypothetical protein
MGCKCQIEEEEEDKNCLDVLQFLQSFRRRILTRLAPNFCALKWHLDKV